jgi:hypothetical protein
MKIIFKCFSSLSQALHSLGLGVLKHLKGSEIKEEFHDEHGEEHVILFDGRLNSICIGQADGTTYIHIKEDVNDTKHLRVFELPRNKAPQ